MRPGALSLHRAGLWRGSPVTKGEGTIVWGMASPAELPDPTVPPADPQAIRACLTPTLAAEFDHEWNTVMDRVKHAQDLTDLHELLATWRHTAHLELRDPGATYRILAKAEQIQRTGHNPDASPVDPQALIQQRLDH